MLKRCFSIKLAVCKVGTIGKMTDLGNTRPINHRGRRDNDDNGDDNGDDDDNRSGDFEDFDDGDQAIIGDQAFIAYGQRLEENYLGQQTRDQYSARVKSIVVFLSEREDFRDRFLQEQADGSYKITSALSDIALTCLFGKICSTPTAKSIVPSFSTVNGFSSALKNYYLSNNIILTKPAKDLLRKLLRGHKKVIQDHKQAGNIKQTEGKDAIKLDGYKKLAWMFITMDRNVGQSGRFAWSYLLMALLL